MCWFPPTAIYSSHNSRSATNKREGVTTTKKKRILQGKTPSCCFCSHLVFLRKLFSSTFLLFPLFIELRLLEGFSSKCSGSQKPRCCSPGLCSKWMGKLRESGAHQNVQGHPICWCEVPEEQFNHRAFPATPSSPM